MNFRPLALATLLAAAPCAPAADLYPGLRAKSLAAAAAPGASAPFRQASDPLPGSLLQIERDRLRARPACEQAARDLCYDSTDGRIVYRPARAFMPRIEGMTPESLSLRRDRIVLRYSFR